MITVVKCFGKIKINYNEYLRTIKSIIINHYVINYFQILHLRGYALFESISIFVQYVWNMIHQYFLNEWQQWYSHVDDADQYVCIMD